MNVLFNFMEKHFMTIGVRLSEQRHLRAVRDGTMASMPILLIGSFFLMIAAPPNKALADMVHPYIDQINIIVNATFGIVALVTNFCIASVLADSYDINPMSSSIISMSAFLVAAPLTKKEVITLEWLSSQGLFVAILVALASVEIQRYFIKRNMTIKMPTGVPAIVKDSFAAFFPGLIILAVFWLFGIASQTILGVSIPEAINLIIGRPLLYLGSSLIGTVLTIIVSQLLWVVGIHGDSIVDGIMSPVWLALTEENASAIMVGKPLPNIICNQFFTIFTSMGGSGSTLALVLLMLNAKSRQLRLLGKASISTSIFNINEPIVFGMPIVMNPIMIIPFILVPVVTTIIGYIFLYFGLAGKLFVLVPWTTPLLINGFLTSGGDIKIVLLQMFNFIVATALYYPFLKVYDNIKLYEEQSVGNYSAVGTAIVK